VHLVQIHKIPSNSFQSRNTSDTVTSGKKDKPSPYDVTTEEGPEEPFFDPRFQAALRKSTEIVDRITTLLRTCGLTSETEPGLGRLLSQAEQVKASGNFGSRTIAVVGDSGEGSYF
jgi:hypothetical protein